MPSNIYLPIETLANNLRSGAVTAEALAEEAIDNQNQHDLGAYKTWTPDRFRLEAKAADAAFAAGIDLGPLQGIPVSVKDLYGVSGYPTFAGAASQLSAEWESEGPLVRALRCNLAPISGKTHMVEFAFGGVGSNPHWGTPRNPWNPDRVPGGSSAGAGVSLGEGSAVIALGSDTAGSIRIPASATGVVGVKTSMGRWSVDGVVPLSQSLDTTGFLSRTVSDAVISFATLDPTAPKPASAFLTALRDVDLTDIQIGVCDWFFEDCDPGVAEAVKTALDELAAAGARLSPVKLPELPEAAEIFSVGGLAASEFATFINTEMKAHKAALDPNVAARFEAMETIPATEYLNRQNTIEKLTRTLAGRMDTVDVIVGPTLRITPPTLASVATADDYRRANMQMLNNTMIANLLQLCAVSLPVGLDAASMPVGMMVMAPLNADERALAVALAIETTLGTAKARLGVPPILAR
jgi:aspartyl-tRNA(Asn)/glutamyl-tRNA(Gln) amidotransferase subunit A